MHAQLINHRPVAAVLRKWTLAFGLLASAVALPGCTSMELSDLGRPAPTISSKMLAEMRKVGVTPDSPVMVRIFKKESELEVWKQAPSGKYVLLKTYPMCRWSGKLGPKKAEGDRQAPEGFYTVSAGMLNPNSQYYLSFNLGYPNRLERSLGYSGAELMVHGACSSSGCYALTDQGIGEIYAIVAKAIASGQGQFQVQAYPFRMTNENMKLHAADPNQAFWANLKEGYDRFGATKRPLQVGYCSSRYVFDADAAALTSTDPKAACPVNLSKAAPMVTETRLSTPTTVMAFARSEPNSGEYLDGGMHPKFKTLLKKYGAKKLAAHVSTTSYPISRPEAALASPNAE